MNFPTHPRALVPAVAALCLAAAAPSAAQAAIAPSVSTGGAGKVTQSSARLTGKVDPQGSPTTYVFQYGPTKAYGAQTPDSSAGSKSNAKAVIGDIVGLAPATTYHYRLVATSPAGTTRGSDRTLKTQKQPLGLALSATPNPVPFGAGTTLNGTLSGTDAPGKTVVLQQNAFPFTAGFATVGNPQVVNPQGGFAFPILSLTATTQYRVKVTEKPSVVSPILTVPVSVTVRTAVSSHRVRRGRKLRFAGTITPIRDGAQVAIQKLNSKGAWVTIGGTIARHYRDDRSRYAVRVTVRRGGSYRVFVGTNSGDVANNVGTTIKIRSYR
jgi:hypothetical protein